MVNIKCGDCWELLKTIPDNSVDLVLTDPPYDFKVRNFGTGKDNISQRKYKKELSVNKYLNTDFDEVKLLEECKRVCKKLNVVFFGTEIMVAKLINYALENDYVFNTTIWHKTNSPPFINNTYLPNVEYIISIREHGVGLFGDLYSLSKVYSSSTNKKDKKEYNHPTIKPLELVKKYLKNHSKEGDLVLDMYMGTGTTGVACREMKRDFIGFEIQEQYFETAKKRIENACTQKELF